MKLITNFEECDSCKNGIVTIGNFDGVHRGHQSMIAMLKSRAEELDVPAVVFTFDPSPLTVLQPNFIPERLTTLERKTTLLENFGVDVAVVYPTDRALLDLSPSEFFEQIVLGQLDAKGLVEGPNFFFGKDRAGDVNLLAELCERANIELNVVSPWKIENRMVSSSAIRANLKDGPFASAIEMLGQPYQVTGKVSTGSKRGTQLGFPTANLTEIATLVPADGVYAGLTTLGEKTYLAAINIGSNPTFQDESQKFEIHLLDFQGDLYGQTVSVDLHKKIRDVATFESPEKLQQQLTQDLEQIRKYFAKN